VVRPVPAPLLALGGASAVDQQLPWRLAGLRQRQCQQHSAGPQAAIVAIGDDAGTPAEAGVSSRRPRRSTACKSSQAARPMTSARPAHHAWTQRPAGCQQRQLHQ
jgi:hypothetical protein